MRHRGAVDVGEMAEISPVVNPLAYRREHDLVDVAEPALPLAHELRLEGAVAVPRHLDLDRAAAVGEHRLGPCRRCASCRRLRPVRGVLVIAEVLGHLLIERRLEHRLGHAFNNPAGPVNATPWSRA